MVRIPLVFALLFSLISPASAQEPSMPPTPKPTVPEIFTLLGQFVRVAYNNEGFVTLGYRVANSSVGQEWMLLEVGFTVRKGTKNYVLKRDAISLQTPDGTAIPMATQKEYNSNDLRGLQTMANQVRDSIDYFPGDVVRPCRLGFFADPSKRTLSYDQVELDYMTACVGRIFFHVAGGIKTGQHWLNVKFSDSTVQVPFRILTKEEEKEFRKSWQEIKKAHDETMKQ